jgi:hypothetical protein
MLPMMKGKMKCVYARVWSALTAVKVSREMSFAQYKMAIQAAFRELADALAQRGTWEIKWRPKNPWQIPRPKPTSWSMAVI